MCDSVRGGMFNAVGNKDFHRASARLHPQPKLLLKSGENRSTGEVGRRDRGGRLVVIEAETAVLNGLFEANRTFP